MTSPQILPRPMTMNEFAPLVGQTLLVDCNPRMAELKLVAMNPLRDRGVVNRPPFELLFRSDPMVQLVAGIYNMRLGEWGPAAIYIEPMARHPQDEPGCYYQAVFN